MNNNTPKIQTYYILYHNQLNINLFTAPTDGIADNCL